MDAVGKKDKGADGHGDEGGADGRAGDLSTTGLVEAIMKRFEKADLDKDGRITFAGGPFFVTYIQSC